MFHSSTLNFSFCPAVLAGTLGLVSWAVVDAIVGSAALSSVRSGKLVPVAMGCFVCALLGPSSYSFGEEREEDVHVHECTALKL